MSWQSTKLIRPLYSSLLRLARKFESNKLAKSLIWRKNSREVYSFIDLEYYSKALERLFRDRDFLFDHRNDINFEIYVQQEFRRKLSDLEINDRISAGFVALKKFSKVWSFYKEWVDAEALERHNCFSKIDENKANIPGFITDFELRESYDISPGMVLLANPILSRPLKRVAVLILECTKKSLYGVVINKITKFNVKDNIRGLTDDFEYAIEDYPLYYGGERKRLQIIHNFPNIGGEKIPFCSSAQLYFGGDFSKVIPALVNNKQKNDISAGDKNLVTRTGFKELRRYGQYQNDSVEEKLPHRIRVYAGCCVWSMSDVKRDIHNNKFLLLTYPSDKLFEIMDQSLDCVRPAVDSDEVMSESAIGLESPRKRYGKGDGEDVAAPSSESMGDPVWNYLLEGLGHKYGGIYSEYHKLPNWIDKDAVDPVDVE